MDTALPLLNLTSNIEQQCTVQMVELLMKIQECRDACTPYATGTAIVAGFDAEAASFCPAVAHVNTVLILRTVYADRICWEALSILPLYIKDLNILS